MNRLLVPLLLLAAIILSGCDTTGGDTSSGESNAVDTAVARVWATATAASRSTSGGSTSGGSSSGPGDASAGTPLADGKGVLFVDNMDINTHSLPRTFNLPGDNIVHYWRITVGFAPPGVRERMLDTELQGNIPRDVFIGAYRLESGGSSLPGNNQEWRYFTNPMHQGDVLYYKLSSPTPKTVAVKVVDKGPTTPTPPPARTWVLKTKTPATTGSGGSMTIGGLTMQGHAGPTDSVTRFSPEPPAVLTPGQELTFTLSYERSGGNANVQAAITIYLNGALDRIAALAPLPDGVPASKDLTWAVPGGRSGEDRITITYDAIIGNMAATGQIAYTYAWQP